MKLEEVDGLLDRAFVQRTVNVRESIRLAEEALSISKGLGEELHEAKSRCRLGLLNMIIGENIEAERQSKLALTYFEEHGLLDGAASSLYNIGSVQYKSSNYHEGLQTLLKCLKYRREIGDLAGESKALKAIGYIYEVFNDTENAFSTYIRCREISQSISDKAGESNACNPLSSIYLEKGDFINALETINKSIKITKEVDDRRGLAFAYYGKAKIFLRTLEFTKAKNLLLKSLYMHREVGENLGAAMCELKLVQWAIATENFDKAAAHVKVALDIASMMNNNQLIFKSYYFLHELERKAKNWEKALEYFRLYHDYKEKVINTESIGKVKNIEVLMNTRRLEREAKLQKEKNEIIERKNMELDAFVYRVSHDLKGPLSSLLGLNNIVRQDVKDKVALHYFDLYHQQTERLNEMVMDLINLTRIKDQSLNLSLIDFNKKVDEAITSFAYLDNFSNIDFQINISSNLEFYCDRGIVRTIVQNLIENAIKYSIPDEPNQVNVAVYSYNNSLIIKVSDTGIGISEALQPKIFDMFFRANNSQPGTGLGLFILKKAIDRIGGEVSVESIRGVGSTFTVKLPYNRE